MFMVHAEDPQLATPVISTAGPAHTTVTQITQDSRVVQAGTCFIAISGLHVNGHSFVPQACRSGASLVIHEEPLPTDWKDTGPETLFIRVEDSRRALSALAARFHGHPSRLLPVIGVTGTDGKSTTVSLIHQLLQLCGFRAGYISTVSMHDGYTQQKNHLRQSTPESEEIQRQLARMQANACDFGVLEATSHGLSAKTARLADVDFCAGVFTNITHEHLEFHGSFSQYRSDKAELFRRSRQFAVLNADDANVNYMASAAASTIQYYSLTTSDSPADLRAEDIQADAGGSSFTLCSAEDRQPTQTSLIGSVNIANILAAALTVHRCARVSVAQLAAVVPSLQAPPGRMISVDNGQPFGVIVDYAHTPGSFERLLPMLRSLTSGKLIVVFGSAGKRDTAKRPMQGRIADQFADCIILTDEDPREEDSMAILKDIAAGIQHKKEGSTLFSIPNRYQAIEHALRLADTGDLVLTLGKGHESTIEYANESQPWNELAVVKETLSGLGFSPTA